MPGLLQTMFGGGGGDDSSASSSSTPPAADDGGEDVEEEQRSRGAASDDPYEEEEEAEGGGLSAPLSPSSDADSGGSGPSSSSPPSTTPSSSERWLERKLAALRRTAADQSETLASVLTEMTALRSAHGAEERRLALENDELRSKVASLEERLALMERDMNDQHALSEYAKVIQECSPGLVDSSYVVKLKSQLCRSLHEMGVLHNQVEIAVQQRDERSASLRARIADLEDKHSKAEMEFMNDLFVMEREKAELVEEYEDRLAGVFGTAAELQVDLDLSRESKRDAMSYLRHMREKHERKAAREQARRLRRQEQEQQQQEELEEDLNDVSSEEDEIRRLRRALADKEGVEQQLRQELAVKDKAVAALQSAATKALENASKGSGDASASAAMSAVPQVDLKTLNYQTSQYAQANGIGGGEVPAAKMATRRKGGAARTA